MIFYFFTALKKRRCSQFDCIFSLFARDIPTFVNQFDDDDSFFFKKDCTSLWISLKFEETSTPSGGKLSDGSGLLNCAHIPLTDCGKIGLANIHRCNSNKNKMLG